ncbi:MAG TPA: PDZ domain-containing protein [Thermoanaerobaculia bacterium]|nr:PDZ domain-containing protein [Thermoanaerobaculia bacterium]
MNLRSRALGLVGTLALALRLAAADGPPDARLLRYPDAWGDFVVFTYAGDLWRAPVAGGPAYRLTSHAGQEIFPKVSPDGKWIAFSAEYSGTRQVYVMPSWGGEPRQLTFYNDVGPMPPRGGFDDWVMGWTKDGKILVRMNRVPWSERMGRYYLVDPKGGLETPLELPEGGSASFSGDGKKLAYCPVDREFRTWKRTRGGRAQDVWVYDFASKSSERITDWKGTDNFPMWAGDTIWFTSDRDRTLNLFAYDTRTKATRKMTNFTEYDVLWPSLASDGSAIAFMNGGFLYRLDLKTEKAAKVAVALASDRAPQGTVWKDVKENVAGASISPSGARVVFEARGDLFSVPAKDGATRNLTATQGIRERSPVWSPDGKRVAYLSDATGEYEIYVRNQDGSGEPKRLTTDGAPWKYGPEWSPDGKKLAYGDRKHRLRILDVESGLLTEVDLGTREVLDTYVWSPDSRWLVYEKSYETRLPGLWAWSLDSKKAFPLGDGLTADHDPAFSTDGKYLFFLSERDYPLVFSAFEFNYLYSRATRVFVAALAPDTPSLFPPKSDEEKGKAEGEKKDDAATKKDEAKKDDAKNGGKSSEKKSPAPTVIAADGFVARTEALPGLKSGAVSGLEAADGAVWYAKQGDGPEDRTLWRFDLKERKEEKAAETVAAFSLSRDGKKLLYRSGHDWFVTDAKLPVKAGDGKLDLSGLKMRLDVAAETAQMWEDGWRIVRDFFYDEKMHGVDWTAMKKRYGALVPYVAHRADLDFLFGELMGELESGHTYVASGDEPKVTRTPGGMLGCEFAADPSGRYRIAKIFSGENWDDGWRSPLTEPGLNVKTGSFLLAIDGRELTTADNPYRLLDGKGNQNVTLLVGEKPSREGARTVTVKTIVSETNLRYLDWVKSRMAMVDRLSGGKVGYIHLPDTTRPGNRMLQKLFYAQTAKPALLIDDRYNQGGFIPDRMIEYFTRKTIAWWARRGIESMRTPGFAHDGPKAMLVNSYSSSGGDALPYFFRLNKLGPIIGTRTWGGLIGLSGNPSLVDGGALNVPTFRIYDREGNWVVENEGITPDIEVFDDAGSRVKGGDPSLEKGVEVLLKELARNPPKEPVRPVPPDMAKEKP